MFIKMCPANRPDAGLSWYHAGNKRYYNWLYCVFAGMFVAEYPLKDKRGNNNDREYNDRKTY